MSRRFVSVAFYALFVVFVAWYLARLDFNTLDDLHPRYGFLAVATVVGLLYRYWGVFVWLAILKGLGAAIPAGRSGFAAVYAKAWLGRYLPGKVTWILGKIYFASAKGIPRRKLGAAAVLEGGLQTGVSLLLALLLLTLDARLDVISPSMRMLLLLTGGAIFVTLLPPVFNRLLAVIYSRLKKQALPIDDKVDAKTLMSGGVLYAVGFLLTGISYLLFTMAFIPELTTGDFLFVVGTFNLAGAIGIIALFAPSGLGVRESVQLLLLPVVMPAELALVVTMAARLWSVAVDVVFFAIANGFHTWRSRAAAARILRS